MKILPMLKIENRNIIPLGEIKAICPEFKKWSVLQMRSRNRADARKM